VPICIEKKLTLSGKEKLFECELVHVNKNFGMLKYVIQRNNDIDGLKISPGDITYGLYWTDRPYTLYVWIVNQGKDRAYYFNVADRVSLQPNEFIWRDLTIDILIDPDLRVHLLDEHELPADLHPDLSNYIQSTKNLVLHRHREIMQEADSVIAKILSDKP
jgi:protein associated with RNAse G/E